MQFNLLSNLWRNIIELELEVSFQIGKINNLSTLLYTK